MGNTITLTAADGHKLGGYRSDPVGPAKGGVVVIQEIFGVNHHIRNVCDRLAEAGYTALAPAIFDRLEPNFESGYSDAEMPKAFSFVASPDFDAYLMDTQAAIKELRAVGPLGMLGFCLGGTVAFSASANLDGLSAAVCYYGGHIVLMVDNKPKIPVLMHFGEKDEHILAADIALIKERQPEAEIYTYPDAGHGFNCDERGSFDEDSADLAWKRSMAFFDKHMSA